jgi:hypothetical protein
MWIEILYAHVLCIWVISVIMYYYIYCGWFSLCAYIYSLLLIRLSSKNATWLRSAVMVKCRILCCLLKLLFL